MTYRHKCQMFEIEIFHPAPDPEPGEKRAPEQAGVTRVEYPDAAGKLRGVVYEVRRGKTREFLLDGDVLAHGLTDGEYYVFNPQVFAQEYAAVAEVKSRSQGAD